KARHAQANPVGNGQFPVAVAVTILSHGVFGVQAVQLPVGTKGGSLAGISAIVHTLLTTPRPQDWIKPRKADERQLRRTTRQAEILLAGEENGVNRGTLCEFLIGDVAIAGAKDEHRPTGIARLVEEVMVGRHLDLERSVLVRQLGEGFLWIFQVEHLGDK